MRSETAAQYVDEKSVSSFLHAVGSLYPRPVKVSGKGLRWLKDDLDRVIDRVAGRTSNLRDAADVL